MPSDKRPQPGGKIDLTADDFNSMVARIKARQSLVAAAPLVIASDRPTTIMASFSKGFYAKLSGSTSPYSFTEQYGAAAGTWANHVRTGTTNAYEVNGTGSLNNKLVWLEPGYPGEYVFQYLGAGSGGGGGSGAFLGCTCGTAPSTLYMTVTPSGCSDTLLNDCDLVYGPTPSGLSSLGLGANCYLSSTTFPDAQTGDDFYYYLSCFSNIFRISRVFEFSIYGSPFLGPVAYHWYVGLPGNTCHPFALTNGEIFLGGDPSCIVEINE
jgi:hypothetical protein